MYDDEPSDIAHSWEIGVTAFTPDEIERAAPIRDDHPYGGLVLVSNTRVVRLHNRRVSYFSALNIGLLGTSVPATIQNGLHDLAGDDKARGWDNQISDGGEPTAMWKIQRRQTHWMQQTPDGLDYEIKSIVGGSLGYVTQMGVGLNWRWGECGSPWWSFNPDYAEYINLGTASAPARRTELYLWGGFRFRHHFYNALLEGQFRDSAVTFDRGEDLESDLWEAAVGATWRGESGYHVTFALRARERELEIGDNSTPVWGSIIIGRHY